jgi:hypothetical protein
VRQQAVLCRAAAQGSPPAAAAERWRPQAAHAPRATHPGPAGRRCPLPAGQCPPIAAPRSSSCCSLRRSSRSSCPRPRRRCENAAWPPAAPEGSQFTLLPRLPACRPSACGPGDGCTAKGGYFGRVQAPKGGAGLLETGAGHGGASGDAFGANSPKESRSFLRAQIL